jgi:hypothetical protein
MSKELKAIVARAKRLHLSEGEFVQRAGINRIRWWRVMSGRTGERAKFKLLREASEAIARLEKPPAPCSLCGRSPLDAGTCEQFGCPFPAK